MNNVLTADSIMFLADWESTLWERFKQYVKNNQELIILGLASMSGNYYAYSRMLNR